MVRVGAIVAQMQRPTTVLAEQAQLVVAAAVRGLEAGAEAVTAVRKTPMMMVPTCARLGGKGNDSADWKSSKSATQTGRMLGVPP